MNLLIQYAHSSLKEHYLFSTKVRVRSDGIICCLQISIIHIEVVLRTKVCRGEVNRWHWLLVFFELAECTICVRATQQQILVHLLYRGM